MHEGGGGFREAKQNTETPESKASSSEKLQSGLEKVASKINELFSDDVQNDNNSKNDTTERSDNNSEKKSPESKKQDGENTMPNFKELFSKLFSDDFLDDFSNTDKTSESDEGESNIEKKDIILEKIEKSISTPEGIKELIEMHPEKAELWKRQLDALNTLNDPDASPAEIRSAKAKLNVLKGQLMEVAVKDALTEACFDVEAQQRVVEGESGGTRPDVIAVNNIDHPIEVLGIIIQPGETLSIECKCGTSSYMTNELNNHIPNQLSGQDGTKVLLTTSDVNCAPNGLAASVCDKYGAKLVSLDVSVAIVDKAIKEVSGE